MLTDRVVRQSVDLHNASACTFAPYVTYDPLYSWAVVSCHKCGYCDEISDEERSQGERFPLCACGSRERGKTRYDLEEGRVVRATCAECQLVEQLGALVEIRHDAKLLEGPC